MADEEPEAGSTSILQQLLIKLLEKMAVPKPDPVTAALTGGSSSSEGAIGSAAAKGITARKAYMKFVTTQSPFHHRSPELGSHRAWRGQRRPAFVSDEEVRRKANGGGRVGRRLLASSKILNSSDVRANGGGRRENDHGLVIQCPARYKLEHCAEKAPSRTPNWRRSWVTAFLRARLPRLQTEERQWNDQQSGSGRRPRRGRASKSQPAGQTALPSQGQSSKCGRQSREMNRMQPACVKPEAVSNSRSAVDNSSFVRPFSVSAAASGESCAGAPGDEFLNGCKFPEHADTHAPFPCQLPDKPLKFRDWLLSFLGVAGKARNGLNHFIALSLKPIACEALPGPPPRDLWPCPPPRPWRRWTAPMNPSFAQGAPTPRTF